MRAIVIFYSEDNPLYFTFETEEEAREYIDSLENGGILVLGDNLEIEDLT